METSREGQSSNPKSPITNAKLMSTGSAMIHAVSCALGQVNAVGHVKVNQVLAVCQLRQTKLSLKTYSVIIAKEGLLC